MNESRRRWLRTGAFAGVAALGVLARPRGVAAAIGALPATAAASGESKRVVLHNLHTGESLDIVYRHGDTYLPTAFLALKVLLRDHRNDARHDIDPPLMDYLHAVAQRLGVPAEFSVISGYRSPQSNQLLRERGSGVARASLHLQGRAIDVRVKGVDCAKLAGGALDLARGGVGYYRRSEFVHLDTGEFRTWKG